GLRVVVVLRADHVGGLSASPAFGRLVEQGLHLVTAMTAADMREAIEGPVRQSALRMETGLVELLLREVADQPGALPLLSHALAETWERREADVLTVDAYRATGGIRSAVAQTAERLFASLRPSEQAGVRAVLLRLVGLSPDGEPVVNRVPLSLFSDDDERARLLDLLADARLVTTDDRSVTVAHEALIRAWPRLRSWLDDDVDGQRMLRHLAAAAEDWQARGRPVSELYRGARLDAALDWRRQSHPELTPVEGAFLDAAAGQARAERSAHQRQNRRLRAALIGTALGLVLAVLAGSLAVQRSRDEGRTARAAQVDRLVAQSIALRSTRRDLAALLAREAYRMHPDATTRGALLGVFTATPGFLGYRPTSGSALLTAGAIMPDGKTLLASGTDGVIRAITLATGETALPFPAPPIKPLSSLMDLSRDGRTVAEVSWLGPASGGGRAVLEVFDVGTRARRVPEVSLPLDPGAVAVSPTGRYVAVSGYADGRVLIYDTSLGHLAPLARVGSPVPGVVQLPVVGPSPDPELRGTKAPTAASLAGNRDTAGLAFTRDGLLIAGSRIGVVRIVDPRNGHLVRRLTGAPTLTSNNNVALSADGSVLVTTGSRGLVRWNMSTGHPAWRSGLSEDSCWSAAVIQASHSLLCGGTVGQVLELALDTGRQTGIRFDMQGGRVSALAASPDERTLVELSDTRPAVARWRLDGAGTITRRLDVDAVPYQYNSDGRWLLVTGNRLQADVTGDLWPEHFVVDARTGSVLDRLEPYRYAAWTTRPTLVAVWDKDFIASVQDLASRRRVTGLQGGGIIPDVAVTAAGGKFLMACGDVEGRSVCDIWELDTGDRVFASLGSGSSGSISANGQFLASTTVTNEFVIYNPRLKKRLATRTDLTNGAISPTGVVAGSTRDGRLSFYEPRTLRPFGASLPGAPGPVEQFEFTRAGNLLATRGSDGAVRLIDTTRRIELGEPIQLTGPPGQTIALRGDGAALAVPDPRGIQVWDLRPGRWAKAACEFAGRSLTRTEWTTYLAGRYRPACAATEPPR
ncbi:MAG: WD40 repeat domain-containing protein, partial [Actinomycetes bacterium]